MKIYLFIVLIHTVCITADSESDTKIGINSRKDALVGQFPYQVSLRLKNGNNSAHICSGALLNHRYILTSASCVHLYGAKSLYAILGALGHNDGGTRIDFENLLEHGLYYLNSKENNLALLRTIQSIDFSLWVQPAKLPHQSDSDEALALYQVSGWNETEEMLQYQEVNLEACKSINSDKIVCVKSEESSLGFQSKSASLLSARSTDVYLAGILSQSSTWSTDDAAIYTRISAYASWIEKNSREEESANPLKMLLILISCLTVLFVILLLLVRCTKHRNRQRQAETATTLPTVSSISHDYTTPVPNIRSSVASEHYIPTAPPSGLYLTTPPPPSYEDLFPNKQEVNLPPYTNRHPD